MFHSFHIVFNILLLWLPPQASTTSVCKRLFGVRLKYEFLELAIKL